MRYTPYLRQAQEVLIRAGKGNPTGLTGIYQHPNPRPVLIKLYNATLTRLEKDFPKESIYRQSVENLTKARLAVVEKNEVTEKIEKDIGCGLIEELIIQANDEYNLAEKMAEWKAWEPLEEKPLEDQWVYFGKRI
ncbi:DEKNAAC105250 [Brettanomyces naardenensis]|uniref:DEKNAAC105250 n=1 Tax=Brettanomyces naardenensis TaxID=13370 RepID=A0A448YSR2_BRENA|nr:DEKNAAC105250 [Brettanomyces naardenensis]